MSNKQDKRKKRAKEKARQANKARAQGRQLDAIGRQNYQLTPEMVELFDTLPVPGDDDEMPYVAAIYRWSLAEYAFGTEDAEDEILQVAALCVMFMHWHTHEGADTMMYNDLIEAALRMVEKNNAFMQRYRAAEAAAKDS